MTVTMVNTAPWIHHLPPGRALGFARSARGERSMVAGHRSGTTTWQWTGGDRGRGSAAAPGRQARPYRSSGSAASSPAGREIW